jgi:RNA polymerase subunit RPABC4/transcription elongation factor Spt4
MTQDRKNQLLNSSEFIQLKDGEDAELSQSTGKKWYPTGERGSHGGLLVAAFQAVTTGRPSNKSWSAPTLYHCADGCGEVFTKGSCPKCGGNSFNYWNGIYCTSCNTNFGEVWKCPSCGKVNSSGYKDSTDQNGRLQAIHYTYFLK